MDLLRAALVLTLVAVSPSAAAQDRAPASAVPDVVRKVLLDPTTYAPAVIAWEATRLDWRSSQVFFRHGWVERNPRFTVSGRANDIAVSYGDGNRQILKDAMATLQISVMHNAAARLTERLLLRGAPNHPKLVRAIGWIERSVAASYLAHRQSASHFRQWQANERRARELGFE